MAQPMGAVPVGQAGPAAETSRPGGSEGKSAMRILLVEDDVETAEYVAGGLTKLGHVVETAFDGERGLELATTGDFDVLVLDRMLPKLDGLSIVRHVRETGASTPILLLTTLGGVRDRVDGLNAGADDYLVKPFALAELVARLQALARRPPMASVQTVLRVGDLEMDLLRRTVHRGGRRIDLNPREFRLLEYLMQNAGQVITRKMLLENVWNFHFDPRTTIVETHLSRLRAKVDRDFGKDLIHTIRGSGYCVREDP